MLRRGAFLRAAAAQGTGEGVGVVSKLLCHGPDLLARGGCHVLRKRCLAEHNRYGGHREPTGAGNIEQRDMSGFSLDHFPPLRSCRPVTAQGPAAQRYSATAAGVRVLPPAFLATTTESPPSVLGPGSRARLPEGYAGCILLIARYLPRYRGYTESAASGPLLQARILDRKCSRAKK